MPGDNEIEMIDEIAELLRACKPILFRPNSYDAKTLLLLHDMEPHLTSAADLIRHALEQTRRIYESGKKGGTTK